MGPEKAGPARQPGTSGASPRRLGGWAATLALALGLLATAPPLLERAAIEASYRQVALVAESPDLPWGSVLSDHVQALRGYDVHALLLPVEVLEDRRSVQEVAASGFPVFLFWEQVPAPGELERRLLAAREAGLPVALVGGVGPPGNPSHKDLGRLGAPDLSLALVEMEGSSFWEAVAREDPGRAVVAHRIPPSDWEQYQAGPRAYDAVLARYARAARERQVRVLVVPVLPGTDGTGDLTYVEAVAQRVRAEGLSVGAPPALPSLASGRAERLVIGAAVGGALFLTAAAFRTARGGDRQKEGRGGLWAAGTSIAAVGGLTLVPVVVPAGLPGGGLSGVKLAAFLAAVVLPTWSLLSLRRGRGGSAPAWRRPLRGSLQATLLSIAGGLLVAGLLSSREALLRLDLFRGVKAMHLLPPVLVALAVLPAPLRAFLRGWGWSDAAGPPEERGARGSWIPAGLGLLAGLATIAAGLYYLGRTGNELVPVPAWERALRDEIEGILGARPRFKELFGHAALFAGLTLLQGAGHVEEAGSDGAGGREAGGPGPLRELIGTALMVAGTVGQLSIVNSFAHLHQPLFLTLQRVGLGWVGGLVLGLAPAALIQWGLARRERRTTR